MSLIDTHAHLYLPEFNDDIDEVMQRATENGIEKILLPNIDSESIEPLLNLVSKYSNELLPMMGLHPTSVKADYESELAIVADKLQHGKFCAIGEIGIDLYWDSTFYKEQVKAFKSQIEMALHYDLPIVVHARDSFDEILEVLSEYKNSNLKGVLHSFAGSDQHAEKAIAMGFYLGVGGISTFKNSGVGEIIARQPIEKLILETDSPYLAPTPKRGKRNESAYVRYVADKLAMNKQMDVSEIEKITTANAQKLFKL
ncbi:TatD family hydrolase [Salinivirga cyanobacteriivorans]